MGKEMDSPFWNDKCNSYFNYFFFSYIWWDDLHPTTGTHQKIANAVSEAIRQTQW